MNRVIGEREFDDVAVGADAARRLLTDMVRARVFDERALALQRRGWMSGYPSFQGQEASQVGAATAMADDDWLFPTYRSNAMQLTLGVPMSDILLFRRGAAEFHSGHDRPVFPQAVPIATQIPHATGAGMAASYRGADHGVVCYFGDGATSEGDFHEGLNFAGVFDAPVLFLCENNHWAISLPRSRQTASDSIAVKAEAYGFEGVQVDGNDPLAVYETVGDLLERVRAGEPVLLESLTYRQGAHTTADDPERYEDRREDLPGWRTADPVDRYARYLREQGVVEAGFVGAAREDAETEVDEAVARAEDAGLEPPETVFDHAFEDLPPRLREQRRRLLERVDREDPRELDL